jgi:hypothetical protein
LSLAESAWIVSEPFIRSAPNPLTGGHEDDDDEGEADPGEGEADHGDEGGPPDRAGRQDGSGAGEGASRARCERQAAQRQVAGAHEAQRAIVAAARKGYSARLIGEATGVVPSRVHQLVKRAG